MKLLWFALVVQLCIQISYCDDVSLEVVSNEESTNSLEIEDKINGGMTTMNRQQYGFVAKLDAFFDGGGGRICSGVVLSERIILTLARCVARPGNVRAKRVRARLQAGGTYWFDTNEILTHPQYNYGYGLDYAILRKNSNHFLMRNFGQTPALPPSRVNDVPTRYNGTATVVGWGRTNDNSHNNNLFFSRLYYARVSIIPANVTSNETYCDDKYGDVLNSLYDGERVLCTDSVAGICEGDWGGPLLVDNTLVGLSFFRRGGCSSSKESPSAYADVQYVVDWIRANFMINQFT